MNPGVVSLRCPACTRPFLSLPQQPETQVACPHCGRVGAAGGYSSAGSNPGTALVQSLRQRVLQPVHRPLYSSANSNSWPPAPPLFAGPARQPPLSAAEPQWPFIPPEADPPTSTFSLAELTGQRGRDIKSEAAIHGDAASPGSGRNLPLGISMLAVIVVGIWLLWLTSLPPMAAEIPVPPPQAPAVRLDVEALPAVVGSVRRVELP